MVRIYKIATKELTNQNTVFYFLTHFDQIDRSVEMLTLGLEDPIYGVEGLSG